MNPESLIEGFQKTIVEESYYKDGASEVLGKSKQGKPGFNPKLEKELSDIFKSVQ
jgi:hypothetical protein